MRENKSRLYGAVCLGLIFICLLILHGMAVPDHDDLVYIGILTRQPLGALLAERYREWSSRTIIEAVMFLTEAGGYKIWRVADSVVITLFVWNAVNLFGRRKDYLIFFLLLLLVPFSSLQNAGWMTTTINYVWPLTMGTIAMRPLKHWTKGERITRVEYPICLICLLFGANMEQMAALLLGAWLVMGVYLYVRKKKLDPFYFVTLVLIILSLVYILTAPGNGSRLKQETANFFPEFAGLGAGAKFLIGFTESAHYYIAGGYIPGVRGRACHVFGVLAVILPLTMAIRIRRSSGEERKGFWWKEMIALCPLTAYLAFSYFFPWLLYQADIPRLRNLFAVLCENRQIAPFSPFSSGLIALQVLVYLAVFGCVALSIFFLYGDREETWLQLLLLAAGFASRVMMGFSPTIYASGDRTALFSTVAILIVCLRNLQEMTQMPPVAEQKSHSA